MFDFYANNCDELTKSRRVFYFRNIFEQYALAKLGVLDGYAKIATLRHLCLKILSLHFELKRFRLKVADEFLDSQ